jgi:hypothetical protein
MGIIFIAERQLCWRGRALRRFIRSIGVSRDKGAAKLFCLGKFEEKSGAIVGGRFPRPVMQRDIFVTEV